MPHGMSHDEWQAEKRIALDAIESSMTSHDRVKARAEAGEIKEGEPQKIIYTRWRCTDGECEREHSTFEMAQECMDRRRAKAARKAREQALKQDYKWAHRLRRAWRLVNGESAVALRAEDGLLSEKASTVSVWVDNKLLRSERLIRTKLTDVAPEAVRRMNDVICTPPVRSRRVMLRDEQYCATMRELLPQLAQALGLEWEEVSQ